MAQRIVVIGGGAAGIGAAGAAKGTDRSADVRVYTEFEDVGYSPCGIPYVHGREIPDFERLFLATRETYDNAGIDIHYETRVTGFNPDTKTVSVEGEGEVGYDKLIVATGFDYADPGVPGTDLANLYYVKNIRRAIEWDKVLDGVKSAVVVEASPLGLEMVTALCHRGIETHLVDEGSWLLSQVADADMAEPVRIPAAAATAVLASFLVQTTARSHGMSPSEVWTARTVPCPAKPVSVVLKCSLAPFSSQESCTGAMMSGSVATDSAHGVGSIR